MSAYLVTAATIDAILSFAAAQNVRLIVPGDCSEDGESVTIEFSNPEHATDAGRLLLEANAQSLAARYGADDSGAAEAFRAAEGYAFVPMPTAPTPLEAAGCLSCFAYQACEHDGWAMSLPQWIGLQLESRALFLMTRDPIAPWGIDSNPARKGADDWDSIAPVTIATGDTGEPEDSSSSRAALIAKLSGKAPEPGPQPEPETVKAKAKAKAKPAPKAKAKAPAKAKPEAKKPTGGKTANPPAAAKARKVKAPATA